jgi:hypothetical protein
MLEQITISIAIVFLNLSIYLLAFSKMKGEIKVLCLLISNVSIYITFFIKFSPELFSTKHNVFLMMFSYSLVFVIPINYFTSIIFNLLKLPNDFDLSIKYLKAYFKIAPKLFSPLITFFQILLIWDLKMFDEVVSTL